MRTLPTLALAVCAVANAYGQPNVVLIVSDDAGWADYGFMRAATSAADPGGAGVVPTPNFDRLAGMGVTFTNAYTGSVCSPSRAMITTGQYGTRFGYGSNIDGSTDAIDTVPTVQGLPTGSVTIWEQMQKVGYDTAAVGKWHLGQHSDGRSGLGNQPQNQGVEFFQGLWSGSRDYTVGGVTGSGQLRETISDGAGAISSDAVIEGDYSGQYVTDVFGDQSADYIRDKSQNDADPFFLYTSFTAPHTPMQATSADLAFIDSLNDPGFTGQRRTYAAMQYAMDRNVGKILDALDDPNNDGDTSDSIAEDTLVMFINDNGGDCCDSGPNSSDNGDLRNGKGSQFDGGMRVPMIVAGGGVSSVARGTVSQDLVHAIDLVPTAFAGAGGGVFGPDDVIDGKNLLPYINGEMAGVAHEDLFISRFNGQQSAVRKGQWKYMYQPSGGYQLYDLDNDINEANNVVDSGANAAVVEELHQLLASYHVEMDKPRHDNQADETNQFDHFRFREEAFVATAFSGSNAWENADNPGASATATWRDGYPDNRMTFRAKSGGSYTATNDLDSVGGFAYMANRVSLGSADAALAGDHSATVNGLPLMMTASRSGDAPVVDLDAVDATADAFTFNVDTDIEVYDDLTIQGDGNQRFVFGGQIREFRPGRSVTKVGAADVTFGGGVDLSEKLDVQGGRVTFTDGAVRGEVLVRTDAAIQVGPSGITPTTGGGDNPVDLVTSGLDLNYDAALDLAADSSWFDAAGTANNLDFASAVSPAAVDTATFPNLSAAYSIPVSGGASGLNNFFEESGPRSQQDGTFEVVFQVTDASAGSDQVLLEAGGENRGVAFVLNDGVLTFNVDGDASDINLTANLSEGWHHAVGVVDLESGTDSVALYLNNQLVGSLSGQTIDDWSGGNVLGLGAGSNSVTGVSSGVGQAFHGDIAIARFYSGSAFGSAEVDQNYRWLLQDIQPPTGDPAVTLAIDGALTLEAGATLALDLVDTGNFDRIEATGSAQIAGELEVEASEGFSAAAGDSFQVISASALAGEFDTFDLPALPANLMWQPRYGAQQASLVVTVAGDYNGDGSVDAADYTVWRNTLGQDVSALIGADGDGDGMVTPADLDIWKANLGAEVAELLAVAVPEPASGASLALILVGLESHFLTRRR